MLHLRKIIECSTDSEEAGVLCFEKCISLSDCFRILCFCGKQTKTWRVHEGSITSCFVMDFFEDIAIYLQSKVPSYIDFDIVKSLKTLSIKGSKIQNISSFSWNLKNIATSHMFEVIPTSFSKYEFEMGQQHIVFTTMKYWINQFAIRS